MPIKPPKMPNIAKLGIVPKGVDLTTAHLYKVLPTNLFGVKTPWIENALGKMKYNRNFWLYTQGEPPVAQIAAKLGGTPLRLHHEAPEHSVFDISQYKTDGMLHNFIRDMDSFYVKHRMEAAGGYPPENIKHSLSKRLIEDIKTAPGRALSRVTGNEPPMSSGIFREMVTKTKRRWTSGEPMSEHEQVRAAVKYIHDHIYNPMFEEMARVGYLENPEAFTPEMRKSYSPQIWIHEKISPDAGKKKFHNLLVKNDMLWAQDGKLQQATLKVSKKKEGGYQIEDSNTYWQLIDSVLASHDGLLRPFRKQQGGEFPLRKYGRIRHIHIHPTLLNQFEEFLENDILKITEPYLSVMNRAVTFMDSFGSTDLMEHFEFIDRYYNALIEETPLDELQKTVYNKNRLLAKRYLESIFEEVMGYAGMPDDPASWVYRASDLLGSWSIGTKLGMILPTSFNDVSMHIIRRGMKPYASSVVKGLSAPLKFWRSMVEFQDIAHIAELYTNHRLNAFSAVSTTRRLTAPERGVQQTRGAASLLFGISLWDHFQKSLSAMYNGHALMRIALRYTHDLSLSNSDKLLLKDLGIPEDDLISIAREFKTHGSKSWNGVYLPQMEQWGDKGLVNRIGAALKKEGMRSQNFPSAGSRLESMYKKSGGKWQPLANNLFRFKQFIWTYWENILIPALQGNTYSFIINGLLFGASLGTLVYVMKEVLKGKDLDEVLDAEPLELTMKGLEETGVFGPTSWLNRMVETTTGGTAGAGQMMGLSPLSGNFYSHDFDAARWMGDVGGADLGTALSTAQTMGLAYKAMFAPDAMTKADIRAMRNLAWFQNHFLIRQAVDNMQRGLEDIAGVYR